MQYNYLTNKNSSTSVVWPATSKQPISSTNLVLPEKRVFFFSFPIDYKSERMKQKLVVRLPMADAKTRSKALKIAVGVEGVISAAIEGNDKDQVVIVGDGVDSVHLTRQLRKRLGIADLVSVAPIDEKKEPEKKPERIQVVWPYQYHTMAPQQYIYEQPRDYNQDGCSIM